ncbi:MAG: RNA polymerase sigma factor [Myxococcota bacterium]
MQTATAAPRRRKPRAPALMRLAARLATVGDDADDLMQATYLRALEHDVPVDRTPWLRRVLTNERHMTVRSRLRREARERVHGEPSPVTEMDDVVQALELAEIVRTLVDELDPQVRAVVHARYFEDRTAADVARDLGVPAGTVRWRLKQGLDTLRTRLDRRYGGRRALWAGAVMRFGKAPTLAASSASKGAMSIKMFATLAALVTVGTAGAMTVRSASQSADVDAIPKPVAAAPTNVGTAGAHAVAAATPTMDETAPAKHAWASRRSEIRRGLAAKAAAKPEAADAQPAEPKSPSFDSMALASELSSIVGMCTEFMTESSSKLQLTAHVIGTPESGAIVEDVTLSEDSESTAALSECLTESMYTLDVGDVSKPYEEDITLYLGNSVTKAEGVGARPGLEMPDEVREAMEQALAKAGEQREGGSTQVVFMGHDGTPETTSLDELPPEVREMAEAALANAKASEDAALESE